MSIWCSWEPIGWEPAATEHFVDGTVVKRPACFERGEVRTYAQGFSNHYPTRDNTHELPATIGVSSIPPWCVPGHDESMDDWPTVGEWLRLDMSADDALTWWQKDGDSPRRVGPQDMTVVLDEDAVRALRDDLTAWLERPHLTAEHVSA